METATASWGMGHIIQARTARLQFLPAVAGNRTPSAPVSFGGTLGPGKRFESSMAVSGLMNKLLLHGAWWGESPGPRHSRRKFKPGHLALFGLEKKISYEVSMAC